MAESRRLRRFAIPPRRRPGSSESLKLIPRCECWVSTKSPNARRASPAMTRPAWHRWASMFSSASFLAKELRRSAGWTDPGHDFGQHILPRIFGPESVFAFAYSARERAAAPYLRDVGTVDAYYQANMDLLVYNPELDLHDQKWPIYGYQPTLPPPIVAVTSIPGSRAASVHRHNIFANGTVADGWVAGAVIGFNCRIEREGSVEDSVLFDGVIVGRGAEVRRAVLDKRVQIRPGARVGFNADEDRRRGFVISAGGVTCVPKESVVDVV